MFLSIFLILIFLFVLYLLLVPIIVFIDTDTKQYYLQLKGLAKASLEEDSKEVLRINLKTFFMSFYFYPIRSIGAEKTKTKTKKEIKGKKSKSNIGLRTVLRIIRSFKVKIIQLNIDTGDCIANSKLYPVFAFLNYQNRRF